MARKIVKKEMDKTRIGSNYGSWFYCEGCNETIGYLCYAGYDEVTLSYQCKCQNTGRMHIILDEEHAAKTSETALITVGNRLCWPDDKTPLITIREKKLERSRCKISCHTCGKEYETNIE